MVLNCPEEGIHIQERDTLLLIELLEARYMSYSHAAAFIFEGKLAAAKKRIQKLVGARLVTRTRKDGNRLVVISLSRAGLNLLHRDGILRRYPLSSLAGYEKRLSISDGTREHELAVLDVKAAFALSIRGMESLRLLQFTTWPLLNQFEILTGRFGSKRLIKPDAFIRIRKQIAEGGMLDTQFYFELDRSTRSQKRFVDQLLSYPAFYKSGGFAVRNGVPPEAYARFPFRVLVIVKSLERRNNTLRNLLESTPRVPTQILITTLEEALHDPLGKIWVRPLDYKMAVEGTIFDITFHSERDHTQNIRRDEYLNEKVIKRSIFD